ncbi:MAG: Spo0B domain-containing protein [Clostridia bacterium]
MNGIFKGSYKKLDMGIIKGKGPAVMFAFALGLGIFLVLAITLVIASREELSTQALIAMITAVLLAIFALMVSFSIIKVRESMFRMEKNSNLIQSSYNEAQKLNNTLRAQRHDFLNHLQVIHGLMGMKHYEDACSYMEKIYSEIQEVREIMKTSCAALNALFQAKSNTCLMKGIGFKVLSTTTMKELGMEPWDLCAIIGNIIDNSIDVLEGRTDGRITVMMSEGINGYVIKVKDNGHGISPRIVNRIFEEGFTTKKEGHGIGLFISKKKLEDNDGRVDVCSSDKGTIFTITIAKDVESP